MMEQFVEEDRRSGLLFDRRTGVSKRRQRLLILRDLAAALKSYTQAKEKVRIVCI